MTARGFCTCKRDFPERSDFHPPEGATWHYLCDKPVLSAWVAIPTDADLGLDEPEPDEAGRIAEVFDQARAELDRGL